MGPLAGHRRPDSFRTGSPVPNRFYLAVMQCRFLVLDHLPDQQLLDQG
jgi:hypothetical protein